MNALINVAGWTLLHFLWQGALIAVAANLTLWLLRRAASHTRYAAACTALIAMLAAPVITANLLSTPDPVDLSIGASHARSSFEKDATPPFLRVWAFARF